MNTDRLIEYYRYNIPLPYGDPYMETLDVLEKYKILENLVHQNNDILDDIESRLPEIVELYQLVKELRLLTFETTDANIIDRLEDIEIQMRSIKNQLYSTKLYIKNLPKNEID